MKKLLSIFVTAALLVACNQSVEEPMPVAKNSDWATNHLNGMVQTIEETTYTPDSTGTIVEMDSCCVEVQVFNDQGYIVKELEKDNKGTVVSENVSEHTVEGKFKSQTNTENGKQVWRRTATYDAEGKRQYMLDYDSTGQVAFFHNDIAENEIGLPLGAKRYSADSTYLGTWSLKYTDGMLTSFIWVDSIGTELYKLTGELNDKGWWAKRTVVQTGDDGATTTTVETYTYDSFDDTGNWTQRTKFADDGKANEVKKRTYTYFKES